MLVLQRTMAVLMAAAVLGFFLVPAALKRHQYTILAAAAVFFLVYAGFNVWLTIRTQAQRRF